MLEQHITQQTGEATKHQMACAKAPTQASWTHLQCRQAVNVNVTITSIIRQRHAWRHHVRWVQRPTLAACGHMQGL